MPSAKVDCFILIHWKESIVILGVYGLFNIQHIVLPPASALALASASTNVKVLH